jgi:hypothetical protein
MVHAVVWAAKFGRVFEPGGNPAIESANQADCREIRVKSQDGSEEEELRMAPKAPGSTVLSPEASVAVALSHARAAQ